MKIILPTSLVLQLIFHSCSTRTDKVFIATDEIHAITLYTNDHSFEMVYNGVNSVKGSYTLMSDTILLTFHKDLSSDFDPDKELTRKILIDRANRSVNSLDNKKPFCANIDVDKTDSNQ